MKKIIILGIVLTLVLSVLSGCGSNGTQGNKDSKSITASGSSALQPLVQKIADLYNIKNPDISIIVSGGGSGEGLKNVLNGISDIGNSDVAAAEKLAATDAATLLDNKVCVVGVGVVVNNEVASLISGVTKDQLKDIFSGKIKNWKEIEGPNLPIVIINRPASSGTKALFVKWGLDGQKSIDGDQSLQTDDSNALVETIYKTKGSIGYLAIPYILSNLEKVVPLYIDEVEASNENIYNNTYPIWGYEHMYTKGTPGSTVQKFLDFILSDSVETQIEEMGYGAIRKLSPAAAKSR